MRRTLLSAFLAAGLLPVFTSIASADLIDLRDGRHLSGTIARQGDVMSIKVDDGTTLFAKPDDIMRVTLTGSITPDQAAGAEWTRIVQQIKTADDLKAVISLHQKFLEKFPAAPNAADVKVSLASYQALAGGNAVKFRGRWVARPQIDLILHAWADAARPATELYRAGRMKEALEAVKTALDADKENPDALTVGGLAAYRSNNLPQARIYFTALAASDPGNVLAENNLAIVCFGQKQPGEGLAHYAKALQAAPDNRLVLDNIIEAVSAYIATGDRNSDTFKALQRQFEIAEKRMEEQQAAKGLYRRGSTWVDKQTAEKIAAEQHSLQDQFASMQNQYQAAQATVSRLDAQIREADDQYNAALVAISIDNSAIASGPQSGNSLIEFIAARDLAVQTANRAALLRSQYQAQRDQLIASTRDLFAQFDRLKSDVAATAIHLTGTQRIMDLGEAENPPAPAALPAAS